MIMLFTLSKWIDQDLQLDASKRMRVAHGGFMHPLAKDILVVR
jgi:hypothetical protein